MPTVAQSLKFPEQGPRHSFLKMITNIDPAHQIRRFSSALLLALLASFLLLQFGCKAGADKVVKGGAEAVVEQAADKAAQKTIKPEPPAPNPPKTAGRIGKKAKSSENKISEADEVKQAAMNIAKNIDTIKKIQICHVENEDEWWVTLFDDIGPVIDLKQYFWDRDSETLRPFLIQKRISKSRFESQLTSTSPDRTCEVMDPPPKPAPKKDK
jgi:hypothetical protein